MPFVLFISYARVNKTRYLEKFVHELKRQILDKTAYSPTDIAFFDTSSIVTGQDWARVLGDALRNSKVIVCLCTPHYLNSQFCGKELQVFLLRRQAWLQRPENAARKAGVIFPVVWERSLAGLPPALSQFQFADDALPKKYTEKGLNALAQVSRERDNFRTVVIKLAERIRDAVNEAELPEWPPLPPFDQIPSIFHADALAPSYQYAIASLHSQGSQWRPFGGPPVSDLRDTVAAHTSRLCREISVNADFSATLSQSSQAREAVVVLTDTDTLDDPANACLIAELDAGFTSSCALFVLPGAGGFDPLAIQRARAKLPRIAAAGGPNNWGGVRSPATLVTELVRAFETLASDLVRADPGKKFEDDSVRTDALASGRELNVAPTVTGPGGSK